MILPEIYCSCEFLEAIQKRYIHHLKDELTATEGNFAWADSAYNLLFNHINLVLDVSEKELIRRSTQVKDPDYNPHFKRLWKNSNRIRIRLDPQIFLDLPLKIAETSYNPRNGFFAKTEKNGGLNHLNKSGILLCFLENMDEILPDLLKSKMVRIFHKNLYDWSFLKEFRYPHNSLIISDNYLLRDDRIISENLFGILNSFMPVQLDYEYDLCIFTTDSIQLKKFSFINDFLKKHFSYKTNLSIVCPKGKKLHDRYIISNYTLIESPGGFDLFQNKRPTKESTQVKFYPITYVEKSIKGSPIFEFHSQLISEFSKLFNDTPEKVGSELLFAGYKKHRLLYGH